jgi:hypothetical protein
MRTEEREKRKTKERNSRWAGKGGEKIGEENKRRIFERESV